MRMDVFLFYKQDCLGRLVAKKALAQVVTGSREGHFTGLTGRVDTFVKFLLSRGGVTVGGCYAKLRMHFEKRRLIKDKSKEEAMRRYVIGLFGLGLWLGLLGMEPAYGQRPFPSPNNPDEEQREECNAMVRSGDQCENVGGGIPLGALVFVTEVWKICYKIVYIEIGIAPVTVKIPISVRGEQRVHVYQCLAMRDERSCVVGSQQTIPVGECQVKV